MKHANPKDLRNKSIIHNRSIYNLALDWLWRVSCIPVVGLALLANAHHRIMQHSLAQFSSSSPFLFDDKLTWPLIVSFVSYCFFWIRLQSFRSTLLLSYFPPILLHLIIGWNPKVIHIQVCSKYNHLHRIRIFQQTLVWEIGTQHKKN